MTKKLLFALRLAEKLCDIYGYDCNPEDVEQSKIVTTRAIAAILSYSFVLQETTPYGIPQRELFGLPAYARNGIFSRGMLSESEFIAIQFCIKYAFTPDESNEPLMKEAWITRAIIRLIDLGLWEDDVKIDPDYLLNGTCLHDIGKIEEMETTETGDAVYTAKGRLFGHLYLGVAMVMDHAVKARGDLIPYDKRTIQQVMHIIASHHCHLEWGALVEPQTIEAKITFELDMLDSRVEMIRSETKDLQHGEIVEKGKFRYYKL